MLQDQDSLFNIMKKFIDKQLENIKPIDFYIVTAVNPTTFTVNIKHFNFKSASFDNVPISSIGLGNFKGIMKIPSKDDLVVVGFRGKNSDIPVVLGTIFNTFGQFTQVVPQIKENELLLTAKSQGSYIFLNDDNDIILRSVSSSGEKQSIIKIGNDDTIQMIKNDNTRFQLNSDGSFDLLNKDGYGIDCDTDGNLTLRGLTITETSTTKVF